MDQGDDTAQDNASVLASRLSHLFFTVGQIAIQHLVSTFSLCKTEPAKSCHHTQSHAENADGRNEAADQAHRSLSCNVGPYFGFQAHMQGCKDKALQLPVVLYYV